MQGCWAGLVIVQCYCAKCEITIFYPASLKRIQLPINLTKIDHFQNSFTNKLIIKDPIAP